MGREEEEEDGDEKRMGEGEDRKGGGVRTSLSQVMYMLSGCLSRHAILYTTDNTFESPDHTKQYFAHMPVNQWLLQKERGKTTSVGSTMRHSLTGACCYFQPCTWLQDEDHRRCYKRAGNGIPCRTCSRH